MASLKLSDSAFGSVGLSITENLDLAALSASLTALLGQNYQFDSLDVSSVTVEGLPSFDPQLGADGLIATGLGLSGSRITVGGFDAFFASFQLGDPLSFTGFETLALTPQTIADVTQFTPSFTIFDGIIDDAFERSLTFDDTLLAFDFSALGTGPLEIRLQSVAPGDTDASPPFSGYQITGNDGDTVIYGTSGLEVSYFGSNTYLLGEGNNAFFGGSDNAAVTGGSGRDLLFGGFGDDILLGGAGNDILFGGESFNFGTSTLDAGAGNDILFGSSGNHELTGGTNGDRFVFANGYDISVTLEGGGSTVNTGFNVSDGESGSNRLMDFDPTQVLMALALDDVMLDPQSGSLILSVGQQTG
ncbi:MAG: hypothetical protein RLP45_07330, partial [Haliea sp.]